MKARPHVLMTADAVGGVWTYALDLGRGLVEAGVRVTLAVPGPAPDAAQSAQAEAAGLELEPLGGALDWTAGHERDVAASAAGLVRLCAQLRPDLVHLNSPALAAFGPFPAPVLAACHSCVKTWWRAVKGDVPLPDDLAWRAILVGRGYAAATALTVPSRAFAQATRVAYGLAAMPHVVLNGRVHSPPPQSGGGGATRKRRDGGGVAAAAASNSMGRRRPPHHAAHGPLPPLRRGREEVGEMSVFTAGRLWDEGKDIATLDRAVGRTFLNATAAGPLTGPSGQGVVLRHIRTLGRLSEGELSARLASRPIFVSPSLYEPFGLAVLEAAQAGCPLALSDIATFRELWDGAAIFFPPGDDQALATLLSDLAADADLRHSLGEAARVRAAHYTAPAMADATLKLYARLSPAFTREEAAA